MRNKVAAARKAAKPLAPSLMRAIYACAREHQVDGEALHEAIHAGFGKASVKELTDRQARQLLDGMRGKVREPQPWQRREAQAFDGRRKVKVDVHTLINDRERELLREAAALRGWDDSTLAAFAARQTGTSEIRTMAQFNKVFWPLKSMNRRENLYPRQEAAQP